MGEDKRRKGCLGEYAGPRSNIGNGCVNIKERENKSESESEQESIMLLCQKGG